MLSELEKRRYKRHIMLPEVGETGQEKLKAAKVLVIGAGCLGSPVLQYLTAAGVGTIGIMDDDVVSEENLNRQILYGGHDLGKLKTIVSKQKLNALNPLVNHEIFNIRLKPENALGFIPKFDLVVDACNDFSSHYLINDACILAKKPWVFGNIKNFEGQVSAFNLQDGPSLRCLFPDPLSSELKYPEKMGVFGVLPGIIGSMIAAEVIKIITGIGKPLIGKLLIYNMLTNLLVTNLYKKDANNFKIKQLSGSY